MSERLTDAEVRDKISQLQPDLWLHTSLTELLALRVRVEKLEEALWRIQKWSEAYPTDIFLEPDLKKAHEVLTAAGMTLDAISAHAMRHVVNGVGEIARAALGDKPSP